MFCVATLEVNVPGFSPNGIRYTVDVFRYDSDTGSFTPYRQISHVERSSFPYTVRNVGTGVYTTRVDGNVSEGVRTFSTGDFSYPSGEFEDQFVLFNVKFLPFCE